GGLLLATGLATPVGAALAIAVMVVAVVSVHLPKGFWVSNGGYEYNLLVVAAALALAFVGPGQYSLDAAEGVQLSGLARGIGALLGGLVLAGGALLSRKVPAAAPAPSK